MIAVAKKNNVLLMEALWTYFLPSYQYVLMVVENNSFGKLLSLEADFGFHTPFAPENRLFKKELGGGSLLDIGIYPVFAALSTLGVPEHIKAKATFFENGADSSCDMIFKYKNAIAVLRSTLLEETKTTAVFTFEKGSISLHSRFHEDTKVTAILEGKAETYKAAFTGIGYCFEIAHFNQLLREDKKESEIMSFEFSKNLLTILDNIREIIGLKY
jgi:predicted dehydrogenase